MTSTLLGASLVAYFAASVLYLANLHIKHKSIAGYGTAAAVLGFAFQTIRLVLQMAAEATPFANAPEAIFFLSWAIAALYLIVLIWFRLPAVGALAMPLSVIALALVYRFPDPSGEPLASDAWMRIHIVAVVTSFAVFALAFCSAIFYLVQNKLLKSKKLRGMFRKLPPLERVDTLGHHLAAVGLPLLTLGIITGVVGVVRSDQEPGAWVKVSALLAWASYAAYLLAHHTAGWRGKKSNWILVAGAVLIAVTTALHKFA